MDGYTTYMTQIHIKIRYILLSLVFGCTVHMNTEPINTIKANSFSSNEFKGSPYFSGLSRDNASLSIYLNKQNNGLIVWSNGIRIIKDSKLFGKEIQSTVRIDKSNAFMDENGNGFFVFMAPFFENESSPKCFRGLMGAPIKNYVLTDSEISSINCFGSSSTSKFIEPIIKLNKSGTGYIVWMNNFDQINYSIDTYVTEIINFQVKNSKYYSFIDNTNHLYLYENEKEEINVGLLKLPVEVKTTFDIKVGPKELTDNNDFQNQKYKVIWTKQNNGFIAWVDENKTFFIQKIDLGVISGDRIKIAENISNNFDIDINESGTGLLIWTENKNILYSLEIEKFIFNGKKEKFVESQENATIKFPKLAKKDVGYIVGFIEYINKNGGNVYLKEYKKLIPKR